MRITIDATSALLRSAGIKSYTYHWVRHLRRLAQSAQDAAASSGASVKTLPPRSVVRVFTETDDIRAFPYLNDFGRLDHEASTLAEWQTLPRLALLYFVNVPGNPTLDWILGGSDIFHASNQVRIAPKRIKLTATVHDLTCWLMPQLHTAGNVRADRSFADNILRRAAGLIAVSENTRQDAIRLLNIAPEKIETIYSGVPEEYFGAQPTQRPRPYALYVGTIEPRKNLDTLLDAWRQLKPELRHEFELIIAGPQGWGSENTLLRIRAEATYLGYVPEPDLPGLVAGATVFVYPSLYEGFGFPVVQAMAAGVAVLTSNNSCLPEVAGDGALLVDPLSASEIAQGLTSLLESESQRARLAARGSERAQQFRWDTCAAKSLAFFRKIADDV